MKLITTTALALVAVFAAAPAAAQYGTAAQQQLQQQQLNQGQTTPQSPPAKSAQVTIKPSAKAQKALIDLQDTVKKNDFASVPAKVAAAQAVVSTKEDRYLLGKLQLDAAVAQKDNAGLAAAIDTIAGSGYLETSKVTGLYKDLGATFYNNKQYSQAQAAYQKALAADPRNVEIPALIGETLFAQGQKAEAAAAFQRAIQARVAAGQKPDENLLKRATIIAYDAGSPIASELGRQWVASYPSAESWRNSIAIYRNLNHPDVEGTLDLLRLMQATNSLSVPSD
jgi:tetratricopeptide (TPR) repeat protein